MSVFGLVQGMALQARANLSGATATTIIDATDKNSIRVVGILLVNDSGGLLTPIVDVYDGTTAFTIRDEADLADEAREIVTLPEFIHLRKGDLLRVTANTGLKVFASYIEIPAARG